MFWRWTSLFSMNYMNLMFPSPTNVPGIEISQFLNLPWMDCGEQGQPEPGSGKLSHKYLSRLAFQFLGLFLCPSASQLLWRCINLHYTLVLNHNLDWFIYPSAVFPLNFFYFLNFYQSKFKLCSHVNFVLKELQSSTLPLHSTKEE